MLRFSVIALGLALVAACHSGTEPVSYDRGPVLRDIDLAHERWLATRPAEYQFEYAEGSSWVPMSAFFRAIVAGQKVILVVNDKGLPVTNSGAISVDSLWQHILNERAKGTLNSAEFSQAGVPLEVDWGPWPVDGGVHFSVRNFVKRR